MATKSRNWCFTRQSTDAEAAAWAATAAALPCPFPHWKDDPRVKYICFQIEKAPDTGKLHVQGCICMKSPCRMTAVKTLVGNNPHCEVTKDLKGASDYCKKPESRVHGPYEFGDLPQQGKRTDLATLYSDIKAGKKMSTILEENPSAARFEKSAKLMRFCLMESSSDRQAQGVKVYVFWGATDLGKTYTAYNLMDPKNVFKFDPPETRQANLWFDGYEGERTIIFDEFNGDNYCSLNKLKSLLDVYKCRLQVKGGYTWANWTTVILTSNYPPRQWYTVAPSEAASLLAPLKRRIYQIRHFISRGIYITEDWDGNATSDQLEVEPPATQVDVAAAEPHASTAAYADPITIDDNDDGVIMFVPSDNE